MQRIIISVLTFNGDDKTIRTISDILGQDYNGGIIELIIIDNCSTNNIYNRITSMFPTCNIIKTKSNIGFSGGNNIAIDIAVKNNADYLFILNDDIQIKPTYIRDMISEAINRPNSAAIGSTIRLKNGNIQAVCGYVKPWFAGVIWSKDKLVINGDNVKEVDVIQGSAFLITKTALQRGFKFDNNLFFGCEEYDLALWSKTNVLKIYVLEHVEVIHNTKQGAFINDSWHYNPYIYYYACRNPIYLKLKYKGLTPECIISLIYTILRMLLKGIIFMLKGHYDIIIFIIRGIRDGIFKNMGRRLLAVEDCRENTSSCKNINTVL